MDRSKRETIIQFFRPYRSQILGLMVLTAVLSVLAMLPPLLIRAVINRVIVGGERSLLFLLGWLMIGSTFIHTLCSFLQTRGVAYIGQKFVMQVRAAVYRHLLTLSVRFHQKHSVGEITNRLMGDSNVLQHLLTAHTVMAISDLVCSAFVISVVFVLNWRLAAVLVLFMGLFVVNYKMKIKGIRRVIRSYRGAEDRVAGGVQNRLVANLTVKSYGMEGREDEIFREQSGESMDRFQESEYAAIDLSMNTALLKELGRVTVYFLGCAMVLEGEASYGDVVAFTAYAMQLLMPAVRFSFIARQIQNVAISLDRLFELLQEEPEVSSRPGARELGRARGEVDFDNITFHYDEAHPVLRNIDLHVRPGETVALVGATGAGKTTMVALLMRFFDVKKGAVRVDGIDVREIDLASLRRQFGIVLQESLLFNTSIADNIRYSWTEAGQEAIERAAKVAEIHDFIVSLPDGYDSEVGSKDVQLSVGQKQRISIARAVLSDPAIVIMDEATSALDSQSERAIQRAMNKFLVGRTSFIVAHRLSTIRNADRILLLDHGRIQEMGSHSELMSIPNGKYRDLYDTHAGKGIIIDN